MSGRASGGAVKRQREKEEKEQNEPVSLETSVQPQPLMLLAVVKSHLDTLVWLQLCNPKGVSLFSFVRPPPRDSQPFAGAPVYDMSLTYAERLRVVGCGLKGKLARLLSLGVGRHYVPQRNWGACCMMMQSTVRRVAAVLAAAVRDKVAKEAAELCASGQCAAAVVPLQRAIDLGHFPSRALMAWLLIDGREGVAEDRKRGRKLAEEGARLGCHHCQGVMAWCYLNGCGFDDEESEDEWHDEKYAQSFELARESSGKGSRYGQLTLGELHRHCPPPGGLVPDSAQKIALYRLAAAQGLDGAQLMLGDTHYWGYGVARDYAEALRWYKLAAAQGLPHALYRVAECYTYGARGVVADVAEANRWYRRAQAAGHSHADCV